MAASSSIWPLGRKATSRSSRSSMVSTCMGPMTGDWVMMTCAVSTKRRTPAFWSSRSGAYWGGAGGGEEKGG